MVQRIFTLLLFLILPTIILAHGSHGNGILAGFTHPILGVDHNVAILGAGILGYMFNPKKWYIVPSGFVLAMTLGGFLGIGQEATFWVEKVIAFSVFSIGWMLALRSRLNLVFTLTMVIIFGAFHGYAHGAEMDASNSVFKYVPGYTLGAILLSGIGFIIGKLISSKKNSQILSFLVSGIIIGCGLMMLLG